MGYSGRVNSTFALKPKVQMIEGARQAGVIKNNLEPISRGIIMSIARGTFTVGHGPKILDLRIRQSSRLNQSNLTNLTIVPENLVKGKALMKRIGGKVQLSTQDITDQSD